jgi:Uma2 family endonuclease
MAQAASSVEPSPEIELGQPDQRLLLHGVSWEQYRAVRDALLDHPALRMTYLEGALEFFMPGTEHEGNKTLMARLLEMFALERNVSLNGYGNETFRRRKKERALEPDECYFVGLRGTRKFPDLAIEVVTSRWNIDKLKVYEGLGVREVWVHRAGRITVYRLGEQGYAAIDRSEVLPDLDLDLLPRYVGREDQTEAVREYRQALSKRS